MVSLLACLGLVFYCCSLSSGQKLSPTGKNVCKNPSDLSSLVCCDGWAQEGNECTQPLCEGERACQQDEVCVYPGMCRCKPGFYGAQCKTRCPPEFWAPDCREVCLCHPNGQCDPVTGECTCRPNRWGPLCQNECRCGRHGRCNQVHGNCTCDEGWWTPTCSKACLCYPGTSTCDPATGHCRCNTGYWGPKCSLRCNCMLSPCQQRTGTCQCKQGFWGPVCDRRCNCDLNHGGCDPVSGECVCDPGYQNPFCHMTCAAGTYGSGCEKSCGHCAGGKPCSIENGSCDVCMPGWNGTRCDKPCPHGYYGNHCQEVCPHCKNEEPCDPETGACSRCDTGWTGPRCDRLCPDGTFGDGCRLPCSPCFHGQCDHVTGSCVCHPGFQGESCNSTCPSHLYGVNCSSVCDCGDIPCHPATGACQNSNHAGLIAGLLIPLLILILALLFCCCCCGQSPADGKDRMAVGDGGTAVRMKHHVYNVLANMGSAMPCLTLWSSGLPRVTVSHHDPELTFNHSFIEPPSSGWVTDNSFESDEGEELYCVPPREDIPAVAGGEFQELSSKCNMFPDPSAFNSEDMALAFGIPRTSSIAKSKRPSVSFAEGTKFISKERRGSAQDLPLSAARKPKAPWGVLMVSALQGQINRVDGEGEREKEVEVAEDGDPMCGEGDPSSDTPQTGKERFSGASSRTSLTVPGGRRRTLSNTRRTAQSQAASSSEGQAPEAGEGKLTTVYVTVGKAPRASKQEPVSEGPVQAMLRRLGSLQKQREEATRPGGKGQAVVKPPRRKLGARASAWEQESGAGCTADVTMRKASLRKHSSLSSPGAVCSTDTPYENTPKRPLSSILKSVPEYSTPRSEAEYESLANASSFPDAEGKSSYQTVGASETESNSAEVITNEVAVTSVDEGPKYENVFIKQS